MKQGTRRLHRSQRLLFSACVAALAFFVVPACGKKGPPLPPLLKLPIAPANFAAERRGVNVDLRFDVPGVNTDNTRPANVARVDVYAVTTREAITEGEIIKQGTKVATVAVKSPRDPNRTIEEDESTADMEPPEGQGLDQGAVAHVSEELTEATLVLPAPAKPSKTTPPAVEEASGPLLPPTSKPLIRMYVAMGVTSRDKKGPFSKPVAVPLVPPPAPASAPTIKYDEKAISLKWTPVGPGARIEGLSVDDDVLPSRPIGAARPDIAYNVYDASTKPVATKLTANPLTESKFSDPRIAWGEERCYTVRTVENVAGVAIEGDAPPPECVTLEDTFPPAPPANLLSAPGEGVIDLIWDANTEKDLEGYIVLRGTSAEALEPITPAPIADASFRDQVQPGVRFAYAVRAVDKAGNRSKLSRVVEESAR